VLDLASAEPTRLRQTRPLRHDGLDLKSVDADPVDGDKDDYLRGDRVQSGRADTAAARREVFGKDYIRLPARPGSNSSNTSFHRVRTPCAPFQFGIQ